LKGEDVKTRCATLGILLLLVLSSLPLAAETGNAAPPDLFRDLWQQVGGDQTTPIPEINICTICLLAYNNCLARCAGSPTCQGQCSAQFTQCTPCDCSGGVPHCR
jgi:hypothetical protein